MPRDTTVIAFRQPEAIDDPLSEVAREGARPCLTASTSILRPRATWRVAGRSSTPVSCWCRRSGTERRAAGWANTSGVEAEARQSAAEGPRCALDPRSMAAASSATRTM
jgi:hypothetical protein